MKTKSCTIKITDAEIKVILEKDGLITSKPISISSLVKLFGNLPLSFGPLPKNCRFVAQQGELTHYCVEVAAQSCPMLIHRNDARNIIPIIFHPNNLFIFSFLQNQILSSFCICTEKPIESLDDEVFRSPFGNTHPDGRICWGTTNLENYKVSDLYELALTYYTSGFNGELDEDSFRNIELCKEQFNNSTLRSLGKFSECFPQFKQTM